MGLNMSSTKCGLCSQASLYQWINYLTFYEDTDCDIGNEFLVGYSQKHGHFLFICVDAGERGHQLWNEYKYSVFVFSVT